MVIVKGVDKIISHYAKKRFGFSQEYGTAHFGYVELGRYNPWAGIYSHYRTRKGRPYVRKAFYWPVNPKTPAQVVCQDKMAAAVAAWQALTVPEKQVYNDRVRRRRMTGFNLYIKEFMLS